MVEITDEVRERFESKYEIDEDSGCWVWVAGPYSDTYGRMMIQQKNYYGHRIAWRIHKGDIPEDAQLNHECHNKRCVNPDHLHIGNPKMNMEDALEIGAHNPPRGENQGFSKLTEEDVIEMREVYDDGDVTYSELADEYGLTGETVHSVIMWKTWRHVEPWREGELKPERMTVDKVRRLRDEYKNTDKSQYDLADEYGITQAQVSSIVNRDAWGHVE